MFLVTAMEPLHILGCTIPGSFKRSALGVSPACRSRLRQAANPRMPSAANVTGQLVRAAVASGSPGVMVPVPKLQLAAVLPVPDVCSSSMPSWPQQPPAAPWASFTGLKVNPDPRALRMHGRLQSYLPLWRLRGEV